jgi:GR25 family glycosyltransferase involved in LPS biosynthesis
MNILTYIINLEHRTDRAEESLKEIRKIIDCNLSCNIFNACKTTYNGFIGNSYSHASAVMDFMRKDAENINKHKHYCLILEDDFEFHNVEGFYTAIDYANNNISGWNVILLSGNAIKVGGSVVEGINECFSSQTASGYLINIDFASEFINLALDSGYLYRKRLKGNMLSLASDIFALDQWWKKSQARGGWLICNPTIIHQRKSYSDVERKVVEYGC